MTRLRFPPSLSLLCLASCAFLAPARSAETGGPAGAAGSLAPVPAPAETPAKAKAEAAHATGETNANDKKAPVDEKNVPPERTTQSLLHLGQTMTDRGDFEAAEIAYRQIMADGKSSDSDTVSALLGLARLYRKQGALTKAAAVYERTLKDFPHDDRTPDALLELGRTLRAMGAPKLALVRFYSVINSTLKLPGDGFARYQVLAKTAQFEIAETHFQSGEFTEANKYFTRLRLLDLAPADRARAHFKAAYALYLNGDYEKAVITLREFLDQCPQDENVPEARYLVAMSLRALKRPQEAFAATLDLLRAERSQMGADPKRWAYWQRRTGNQLANDFFEAGDILNAQSVYTSLAALSDDPIWRLPVVYQIALCQERLGLVDQARTSYQSIVAATASATSSDLTELGRMAQWRIGQLEWRDKTRQQIAAVFETKTGQAHPAAPAIATSAPVSQ